MAPYQASASEYLLLLAGNIEILSRREFYESQNLFKTKTLSLLIRRGASVIGRVHQICKTKRTNHQLQRRNALNETRESDVSRA